MRYRPTSRATWIPGDFREAASIRKGTHTIETLAALVGASLEHFVEDGLGPGQIFGAVSSTGRQIAFEFYELGQEGPNLLVLFEKDRCKGSDVFDALAFFGVTQEDLSWRSPTIDSTV